jgi:hypothetical protein
VTESKYRILFDYGGYDGMSFMTTGKEVAEFNTPDEAMKAALDSGWHTKFLIVKVIKWDVVEI